jgi:hypothetical protein
MIKKYCKISDPNIIVEAIQWINNSQITEINNFITTNHDFQDKAGRIYFPRSRGTYVAVRTDYIVKEEDDFSPYKADVFEKLYREIK